MSTVIDGTVGITTPTTGGLILQGSTSGTCTVNATAISGTAVLTMPTGTGTLISTTGGVTPSTSGNLLTSNGTTWVSQTPAPSGVTVGKAIAMSIIFGF